MKYRLFSGSVFHVLVEVASLCGLNSTEFGEGLILFKDKCGASAVTERACLGFEDFRKRTDEIRSADAGVYTKSKLMTL
jgi:hypothetical protein